MIRGDYEEAYDHGFRRGLVVAGLGIVIGVTLAYLLTGCESPAAAPAEHVELAAGHAAVFENGSTANCEAPARSERKCPPEGFICIWDEMPPACVACES